MSEASLPDVNQTKSLGPLQNNVVLLVGGTSSGGRFLAVSLAKRGADIAVVYAADQKSEAAKIKRQVHEQGRRCLTIPVGFDGKTHSRQVVQWVIETLGRLDLFIDYAALPCSKVAADEDGQDNHVTNPFSNFELMASAMREMVNGKHTATSMTKLKIEKRK